MKDFECKTITGREFTAEPHRGADCMFIGVNGIGGTIERADARRLRDWLTRWLESKEEKR